MTDTSIHVPTPTGGPGGFRRGALVTFRALGAITLIACVVQIVFAGLGAYGASFDAHRMLGGIIGALTLLMLILVLVARPSWTAVGITVLLVLLATAGQTILANLGDDTDAWFGGIHALNGLVIMGLLSRLAFSTQFTSIRADEVTE
ncbi:MAG: DUF6220 domain-containing protein [Actinomycetia bacterium]|nr:DUF6220 domain-containing protein [Actinomycetes bacterium]